MLFYFFVLGQSQISFNTDRKICCCSGFTAGAGGAAVKMCTKEAINFISRMIFFFLPGVVLYSKQQTDLKFPPKPQSLVTYHRVRKCFCSLKTTSCVELLIIICSCASFWSSLSLSFLQRKVIKCFFPELKFPTKSTSAVFLSEKQGS